jgi:5-hydroxyisourate hydrolase
MPGISIHVVDVASGSIAEGMRVELVALNGSPTRIATGTINAKGILEDSRLEQTFSPGYFEAVLHVGEFYRRQASAKQASDLGLLPSASNLSPNIAFLDIVTYRFGIQDPSQHFHLPFKITAWGYSCFRGGA